MKLAIAIIVIASIVGLIFYANDTADDSSNVLVEESTSTDVNDLDDYGYSIGDVLPDFAVTDREGNAVKLSDFSGQPVFINFWATWCPFCVEELPVMVEVQREFSGQFVTLAINRGESVSKADEFLTSIELMGEDLEFVYDKSNRLYSDFGAFGMPYSVFLDKDGRIDYIKRGALQHDELHELIEGLI